MQWAKWRRPDPATIPAKTKAAGLYMICTLSKHAAERAGYNDALMLDYRGYVAEATGANIFLVIDGKLHTPLPDCFLDGITRRTVIALAKERGLEVVQRHIQPEELAQAQEVFLTGTAVRSEEHTSELQSLMRISYTVFSLTKKKHHDRPHYKKECT